MKKMNKSLFLDVFLLTASGYLLVFYFLEILSITSLWMSGLAFGSGAISLAVDLDRLNDIKEVK